MVSEIKRYEHLCAPDCETYESKDGEWVKHEDLEEVETTINALHRDLDLWKRTAQNIYRKWRLLVLPSFPDAVCSMEQGLEDLHRLMVEEDSRLREENKKKFLKAMEESHGR
jgi:hypothetical protein